MLSNGYVYGMASYIFQSIGGYVVGTGSAIYIFMLILLGAFVLCGLKWARIVSLAMSILLVPYIAYFLLIALVMGGYKTGHDLQSVLTILIVSTALALAILGSMAYWGLIRSDFKTK